MRVSINLDTLFTLKISMEEKKRVLKSLTKRMPEKKFLKTDLQKAMMEKVGKSKLNNKGLKKIQVNDFIDEMMKVMSQKLQDGYSVLLPEIATLYPTVKPGKIVMNMRAGKEGLSGRATKGAPAQKMYMPARFVMKMRVSKHIKESLLKTSPTEEEVNNLYKD